MIASITPVLIRAAAILLLSLGMVVWVIRYTVRRSADPTALLVKWIVTLLILGGLIGFAATNEPNQALAFIIPLTCVAIAVVLSLLWAPHVGALFAKPITSLFDGGDEEPEAKPLYSQALAKRLNGHYAEAVDLVQAQLDRFPNDFEGMMILGSIYAENLNDLGRADVIVQRICNQESVPPNQLAGALNALADWHVSLAQDAELARQALEKILERLPGTEYERAARQRIAHLASTSTMVAEHDRPKITMKPGLKRIGLRSDTKDLVPVAASGAEQAKTLLAHLAQFPDDNEARESLARVYAEEYHRPEMAIQELEQLIARPHQPVKLVAHWLNQIADYQIKLMDDVDAATATLGRIATLFPGSAVAEMAASRVNLLKLEQRGQKKTAALTLGEYEQRLGLKRGQRRDDERGST